jgi:hypothetical protein
MIPIKYAINSGAWFNFISEDESIKFRLKVLSFEKIDLSEVDEPEKILSGYSDASWWLMKIELISFIKHNVNDEDIIFSMSLIDKDGFSFGAHRDYHMCAVSEFGKKTGLRSFYGEILMPKIKVIGALTFILPDDEEAEYSLSMDDGTVTEA